MMRARPANPWLDLVRSVAIGLVLVRHGERVLIGNEQTGLGWFETFCINGWVGVDLFFVLSGFLIARHLLDSGLGSPEFGFVRYIVLRALRIVPAYVAMIALIVAGVFPLYEVAREELPFRLGYHLLFLQDYLPSTINVAFWSLGVEEKFYLVAPFLVLALLAASTIRSRVLILSGCFLLPVILRIVTFARIDAEIDYTQFFETFRSPFHNTLEGLMLGVAIVMAQRAKLIGRSPRVGTALLVSGGVIAAIWLSSHDFMAVISVFDITLQPIFIAILAAMITTGAVMLDGVALAGRAFFRALARLSYCLYLVHIPLLPMTTALAAGQGPLAFWPTYLAASTVAAWLLHVCVERPFLALKGNIADRAATANRFATPAAS
jgi:peptidoglycan/LPS O-acetylase OafA/YrhL